MTRILLVDDDEAIREATTMMLESRGYDVVAAPDGKAAVEKIRTGPFDIVIVDLFMPGMDGLETTRAIRQCDPSVPVIAVSGFMLGDRLLEMPNFGSMAAEAGACATLYKPFRPDALLNAIAGALHGPAPIAAVS